MYSDMSMRTIDRSSSKRNSARARASSVLPTPVGPEEQEAADGPVRVREAAAGPTDGVGHGRHRLVLADDPLVEHVLHAHQLGDLALEQAADRDAGPLGDDLGDVLLVDLLLEHLLVRLQVAPAGRWRRPAGAADPGTRPYWISAALARSPSRVKRSASPRADSRSCCRSPMASDASFSLLPAGVEGGGLLAQVGELLVELGQALPGRLVGLLGQRQPLDLELGHAPVDHVDLGRLRLLLDAQPAGGLVDQVDGLVRQEPAR